MSLEHSPGRVAAGFELRTAKRVREQLGGISAVSLWRYQRDSRLNFPVAVRINGRLYFRADEIDRWIETQSGEAA